MVPRHPGSSPRRRSFALNADGYRPDVSQEEKDRQDHLHADQDDVGGSEEPFSEQSGDSNVEPPGAGGAEHGASKGEPMGHDKEGGPDEAGVDVEEDTADRDLS